MTEVADKACPKEVLNTRNEGHPCDLGEGHDGPCVSRKYRRSVIIRRRWEAEQEESIDVDVDVDSSQDPEDAPSGEGAPAEFVAPLDPDLLDWRLRERRLHDALRAGLDGELPLSVQKWLDGADAQLALKALWNMWAVSLSQGHSEMTIDADIIEGLIPPRMR